VREDALHDQLLGADGETAGDEFGLSGGGPSRDMQMFAVIMRSCRPVSHKEDETDLISLLSRYGRSGFAIRSDYNACDQHRKDARKEYSIKSSGSAY
jgi:hypothetical protein